MLNIVKDNVRKIGNSYLFKEILGAVEIVLKAVVLYIILELIGDLLYFIECGVFRFTEVSQLYYVLKVADSDQFTPVYEKFIGCLILIIIEKIINTIRVKK